MALVSHLYSFPPTPWPSFAVAVLLKVTPQANTLSSLCSSGCHDKVCPISFLFAYWLQEICALHHHTGSDAGSTEAMWELCQWTYIYKPENAGTGQLCKTAHRLLFLILINQKTTCRSTPAAAVWTILASLTPTDTSWPPLPIPLTSSNADKLQWCVEIWSHTKTKKCCLTSKPGPG